MELDAAVLQHVTQRPATPLVLIPTDSHTVDFAAMQLCSLRAIGWQPAALAVCWDRVACAALRAARLPSVLNDVTGTYAAVLAERRGEAERKGAPRAHTARRAASGPLFVPANVFNSEGRALQWLTFYLLRRVTAALAGTRVPLFVVDADILWLRPAAAALAAPCAEEAVDVLAMADGGSSPEYAASANAGAILSCDTHRARAFWRDAASDIGLEADAFSTAGAAAASRRAVDFVSEMSKLGALRGGRAVLNDQTLLNHRLVVARGARRLRWGLLNQTRFLTRCTFRPSPAAAAEGVLLHAACTPAGRHFEKFDAFRGILALRNAATRGGGSGRADGGGADGSGDYTDGGDGGGGGGGGGPLSQPVERCLALHLGNLRGDLPRTALPGPCRVGHTARALRFWRDDSPALGNGRAPWSNTLSWERHISAHRPPKAGTVGFGWRSLCALEERPCRSNPIARPRHGYWPRPKSLSLRHPTRRQQPPPLPARSVALCRGPPLRRATAPCRG